MLLVMAVGFLLAIQPNAAGHCCVKLPSRASGGRGSRFLGDRYDVAAHHNFNRTEALSSASV